MRKHISDCLRIEVISPPDFPYGRSNLMVRLWEGERLVSSRTAFVDVRRRQNVLVSRKTIGRTTSITDDDVHVEERFVDVLREELRLADLSNLSAKRTIQSGALLTLNDFHEETVPGNSEQLIRARDAVRITGHRKSLRFVVPAAEALQPGVKGQLIRVRNLHSNKIVVGRVTGRGEVEVPLE